MRELSPARLPRLWAAWSVALVALVLVLLSVRPVAPLAQRAGWNAAVEYLASSFEPADFVVVWPPEQAAALVELPPALRAADAVPVELPAARRYLRILVVGPAGFGTPPELGDAKAERRRFDEVEVGEFVYSGHERVAFDLRSNLGQATVELRMRDKTIACDQRRQDGGWGCPGRPEWNRVAPASLVAGTDTWPCVWAHPVSDSELVIDLGPQTLFDRVELDAAIANSAVATANGAPVRLRLDVDGVGSRALLVPNRRGIVSTSLQTGSSRTARIRVVITTANDSRRHLGINLRLVEDRD